MPCTQHLIAHHHGSPTLPCTQATKPIHKQLAIKPPMPCTTTQRLTPTSATHHETNSAHHGPPMPWPWGTMWSKVPPHATPMHNSLIQLKLGSRAYPPLKNTQEHLEFSLRRHWCVEETSSHMTCLMLLKHHPSSCHHHQQIKLLKHGEASEVGSLDQGGDRAWWVVG